MRIEEVIGRRMRDVRETSGMTQEQLGERLGELLGRPWSRQAVSTAESGNRAFTAMDVLAIAVALGTTVAQLFTPPVDVREVELPTGATLKRSAMIKTSLGRASSEKAVEMARETLRTLAQATIAASEHNNITLRAVETLNANLDLVMQTPAAP